MWRCSGVSVSSFAVFPFSWSSVITLCSIGRPWVSQPGTKRTRRPSISAPRTTKSFSTLLSMCPMWIGPFAYGGPSWKTNGSDDSRTTWIRLKTCASSQRLSD